MVRKTLFRSLLNSAFIKYDYIRAIDAAGIGAVGTKERVVGSAPLRNELIVASPNA